MTGRTPGDEPAGIEDEVARTTSPVTDQAVAGPPWRRLHSRMIWVDVAQSVLALTPGAFAVWVLGVEPGDGGWWPLIAIAAFGVLGAVSDAVRWVFTRYRVTEEHVEARTGIFVRSYRSVRRDRIRSVDVEAKLRHRLAGLRVVTIGAGQQSAAGEAALALDAVLAEDADELRHLLLRRRPAPVAFVDDARPGDPVQPGDGGEPDDGGAGSDDESGADGEEQVFARLRPRWVVYNVFSIWAYILALGLLWGGHWLGTTVGIDAAGFVVGALDWQSLGWVRTAGIAVAAVGAFGVVGMALYFFVEYWGFELARVPGEKGTLLRTRQGLFTTREVNRDDNRMRGVEIAEPLLWRWMGAADTTVITTGLDVESMSSAATILPRGPIGVARSTAAAVLGTDPSPLQTPLARHPRAALRRRLWWATGVTASVAGLLGWLAVTDVIPPPWVWAGVALWPVALGGALVAYRALGHAIAGQYLVVRSGLMSRSTAALQRPAVSTVAIRESPLQRRLGLRTVSAMTSAGYGVYEAPDLDADDAVAFATRAAPGLLDPFLVQNDRTA